MAVSLERLSPYRSETSDKLPEAIALYEWNAAVSAAFWLDIGHLEVLIRNAIHSQLTAWSLARHGNPHWYDDPDRVLAPHRRDDVSIACARLVRASKPATPGRIVAELSFGFWRYLTASQYDRTLWKPIISRGFPGQPRRRPLHARLAKLHELRNRLAHHEPIHRIALRTRHDELLTIVDWIDPVLREWVEGQSNVVSLISAR